MVLVWTENIFMESGPVQNDPYDIEYGRDQYRKRYDNRIRYPVQNGGIVHAESDRQQT